MFKISIVIIIFLIEFTTFGLSTGIKKIITTPEVSKKLFSLITKRLLQRLDNTFYIYLSNGIRKQPCLFLKCPLSKPSF